MTAVPSPPPGDQETCRCGARLPCFSPMTKCDHPMRQRPASAATPTAAGQATYPLSDEGIPMCPCYGRTEVCDQPGGCTAAQPAEPPADFAAGFHAALRRQPPAEAQQDENPAWLYNAASGWIYGPDPDHPGLRYPVAYDVPPPFAEQIVATMNDAARPSADTETLPTSVDQLTRAHFGQWVDIPNRQAGGYLYVVRDEFHDGYPSRYLVLVDEDGAAVEEEFTDSNPARYPKTMSTPCTVRDDRPTPVAGQQTLPDAR